jgi:UDP-3-O-[3-hydroxymyristoyl] glucosamine N-acyltransferase
MSKQDILPIEFDLESVLSGLDIRYEASDGKRTKVLKGVASLADACKNDLSFCSSGGEYGAYLISMSDAGAILCKKSIQDFISDYGYNPYRPHKVAKVNHKKQHLILVDNPRLAFIRVVNRIKNDDSRREEEKMLTGISHTAVISENAKIGTDCYIGNFVVVGDNCSIGDKTIIHDRVSLVQNCDIGRDCIIQSGATIGSDGFSFERDYDTLELEKFPHLSGVKIGNNVEICANSSIARGSLSDTVIGEDSKLDALVHVAHNVIIGRHCELTAGTIIGGSTTIGDTSWMGLNCTLKNKINIGSRVIVGCGAAVINGVPNGDVVAGVPAKSIKHKVSSDQLFLMAGQRQQNGRQDERTKYLLP